MHPLPPSPLLPPYITMALLAGLLALCPAAMAASSHATASPHAKTSGKRSQAVKIKESKNNSQESVSERDRRLQRECKGRPNAGACLGYATR